jgi:hypothetical protein
VAEARFGAVSLRGWVHVVTGRFRPLPEGHKPPEYDVGPEWEPVFVAADTDTGAAPEKER